MVPIYVLNLDRALQRREHVARELAKYSLADHAVWVPCVDCEDFQGEFPGDYNLVMSMKSISREMGLGEIACLWSHLKAYQMLIDSGEQWGIVLEDDVELVSHPIWNLIDNPKFEGAKLVTGSSQLDRRRKVREQYANGVVELIEAPFGGYCYAISRKFAAETIAHLRQGLYMPIDTYFQYRSREETERGKYWQVEGVAKEASIGRETMIGDESRWGDRNRVQSNDCPLLIHQIWLGPDKIPEGVWKWAVKNPLRLHTLWQEVQLKPIVDHYGMLDVFESYLKPGYYCGAADIARYCLLHRFGGFYADADSRPKRPLDIKTPFLVWENEKQCPGRMMNGFIQSRANFPLWRECLQTIRERAPRPTMESWEVWRYTGPGIVTELAKNLAIDKLPSGYFCPIHYSEGAVYDEDANPYCDHDWLSTHAVAGTN